MIREKVKNRPVRSLAGVAILISAVAIAGQGVLAILNTTASNPVAQNVSAGNLELKLEKTGATAGFDQNISNLAPGDVVNRYVTLTNTGSLDGVNLSMSAAANTTNQGLVTDGTTSKALRIAVSSCSQAWSGGLCNGAAGNIEIAEQTLGAFATAKPFVSGSLNQGAIKYLQVKLTLPDQNETTNNGVYPANSIQGASVAITYTFDLAQRAGSSSNS